MEEDVGEESKKNFRRVFSEEDKLVILKAFGLFKKIDWENNGGNEVGKEKGKNSNKFAIQNFAKSLLDVADNLGRASSVVKESFSKIDTSSDFAEVMKLLKILLEGVEARYLLHDCVIRSAEVGVTQAKEDNNPAE
ncbi:grpE protein 2, mitochondrial [Trifolium repens]|nr:grpE protein 2, mitochondrial [Trifolium repens]